MSGPVHHSSRPSHPSANPPADPPKDKPKVSQYPGVDTLYSAAGSVKLTFSSVVINVLNGAQFVVKTIAYVLFYPFFNHDSPDTTPEQHEKSLEIIKNKDSTFKMRFREFEREARAGSRNKADAAYAKEIIHAFAEVEKADFEEIAKEVIATTKIDMDQITLTHGTYVFKLLESGSMTLLDFYHGLNMYRIRNVHSEEQLTILAYEVELAELNKGEVPSAQAALLLYAEVNPSRFKLVAECLVEVTDEVKASGEKALEVEAKNWIEKKGKFNPAKMREALDLMLVGDEVEAVKDLPFVDQLKRLSDFIYMTNQTKKQVTSEARKVFISKQFLYVINQKLPELMGKIAMEMIRQDEGAKKPVGLFAAASNDAKWGKIDFDPVHHVLTWIKGEKFESGRDIIFYGLQRLESNVLKTGFSTGKLGSVRLNYFDLASIRFGMKAFAKFISDFVWAKENEKIGPEFVRALIQIDAAKANESPDTARMIPEQAEDADLTAAVVKVAEDLSSKVDAESKVFQGRVRDAVASVQSDQFQLEMQDHDLEFPSKLESFLLLSSLPLARATFPREMLASMASSSGQEFTKLVLHIVEKFSAIEAVKRLDERAKASEKHPDQIAKARQNVHEARYSLTKLFVSAPQGLTEQEKTEAKEEAYCEAFLKHFATDSATFKPTDMEWLCPGMDSYLAK